MFRRFIVKALRSADGQALLTSAVCGLLEDQTSTTRAGMMRIIRGEARDALTEAQESTRLLLEMDPHYQDWAQQRRQALLAQQENERAALVQYVHTGTVAEPHNPLEGYVEGRPVLILDDALFERRKGRIHGAAIVNGYPEVSVILEGYTVPITFTPAAMQLLAEDENGEHGGTPADGYLHPAVTTYANGTPTQTLPVVEP